MIRPTGSRVLIERLDGDGREETRPSGIIIPARDLSVRRGNTYRVPDTFRALVLAVGPKAQHELSEGLEVVVETYEGDGGAKSVGVEVQASNERLGINQQLIVELDDILCAFEPERSAKKGEAIMAVLKSPAGKAMLGIRDFTEEEFKSAPVFGLIPKTKEFEPPKPPESVKDLGFHRAADVDDAREGRIASTAQESCEMGLHATPDLPEGQVSSCWCGYSQAVKVKA